MEYDSLIQNIAQGDMDSLEQLYNAMYSSVFALILSIVKSAATAADLTQDAFVRVYYSAKKYKPAGKGNAWILRIARNLALNQLRRQRKETPNQFHTELCDKENPYSHSDAMMTLQTMFLELTVEEREVVMLKTSGYTHKEIARVLKQPESTVRWRYANAMKKLRQEAKTKTANLV